MLLWRGLGPNWRGLGPNWQGLGPNWRGLGPNCRGLGPNCNEITSNYLPLLSRGWQFSGYSFTTVCIEPVSPNAGLYAVLED
jgi:hypothetical protein